MSIKQKNIQEYKFTYRDKELGRQTGAVYFDGKAWIIKGVGAPQEFISYLRYQRIEYPADIDIVLDNIRTYDGDVQQQFDLLSEWLFAIEYYRPKDLVR